MKTLRKSAPFVLVAALIMLSLACSSIGELMATPEPTATSTPEATSTPRPTPTSESTPTQEGVLLGWKLVEVPASNFAVAFPDSWTKLDLDPATLEQSIQKIKDENPEFGSILEGQATSLISSGALLFGVDSKPGNAFTANMNVLKLDIGMELPLKDLVEATAAQMESTGTVTASKIDMEMVNTVEGEAGVMRYSMTLSANGVENNLHAVQMLYLDGQTLYVMTMMCTIDQANQYDDIFNQMIYSFRIQ